MSWLRGEEIKELSLRSTRNGFIRALEDLCDIMTSEWEEYHFLDDHLMPTSCYTLFPQMWSTT